MIEHRRALYGLLIGDTQGMWVGLEQRMLDFTRRHLVIHFFSQTGRRHLPAPGDCLHVANPMSLTYCAAARRWALDIPRFSLPSAGTHSLGEIGFHLLWRFLPPDVRAQPIDVHINLEWPSNHCAAERQTRNRFWSTILEHEHARRPLVCDNVVAGRITGRLRDPWRNSLSLNHVFGFYPVDTALWPETNTMTTPRANDTPLNCDHIWSSSLLTHGLDASGMPIQSATCNACGTSAFEHSTGESLRERLHIDRHACITQGCVQCLPSVAPPQTAS